MDGFVGLFLWAFGANYLTIEVRLLIGGAIRNDLDRFSNLLEVLDEGLAVEEQCDRRTI